jgi:hypothetical protein
MGDMGSHAFEEGTRFENPKVDRRTVDFSQMGECITGSSGHGNLIVLRPVDLANPKGYQYVQCELCGGCSTGKLKR